MPETVAGGAPLNWSILYRATATVTNPRSAFIYNSGPGPITLKGDQLAHPDPSQAWILETNVPSMTAGQTRTDNWSGIMVKMPYPTATINACQFRIGVGEADYAARTLYVKDERAKTVTVTGEPAPPPEPTYTIPSVTHTGEIIPGKTVTVVATVMASATAPRNLNVVAEIRDAANTVRGSAMGVCYISGKTTETVTIPIVVATTAPKGAGQICARIL